VRREATKEVRNPLMATREASDDQKEDEKILLMKRFSTVPAMGEEILRFR